MRKRDEDIEEQRREIGQLKQERGILLDGETREREALRQREEEWGAEKVCLCVCGADRRRNS